MNRAPTAVGCDVTPSFKKAVAEVGEPDWNWIYQEDEGGYRTRTKRQWAEVCFVPNEMVKSGKNKVLRYLATRELLEEQPLPGMEDQHQEKLPFQTVTWDTRRYKVFGIVTDMKASDGWTGEKVVGWLYERCGCRGAIHRARPRGDEGRSGWREVPLAAVWLERGLVVGDGAVA